jgi:hypothetical protein
MRSRGAYGWQANGGASLTYDQSLTAEMERRPQMKLHGHKTDAGTP